MLGPLLLGPARADEARTVFFAGLDSGHSLHGHMGFKRMLGGSLDRSGFVAMGIIGAGGRQDGGGHPIEAGFLGGYQWALPRLHAGLFLGPEVESSRGLRAGARVQGEIWARPTDDTLLTVTLIAGSARPQVWGRVSAGYRLWDDVHFGPEGLLLSTNGSWRNGAPGIHLDRPAACRVTWRLAAGAASPWRPGGLLGALSGMCGSAGRVKRAQP
jgi:hypothetical protein